jgi:hypothetical protein
MAMDIWVNLFSSVLVMFFLFYVFIKFFLRIFEDRIKFMERLYDGVVDELRSLVRELHLLRVEVGLLVKGGKNLKNDIDEEVEEYGNG